mmetsp:Transcript_34831/g.90417  ORF Transcript_34831/g.90417 Transcript_34831/m.90417 type:complete len:584 (-) Transcript_34831:116-1867(-)
MWGFSRRTVGAAVLPLAVLLCILSCLEARSSPIPTVDEEDLGTTRVVLQTLFGEVKIGLFTKEAPVVTDHFLKLVHFGCMDTNHMLWDDDGVLVPGCEEKQLRSNSRQRALAGAMMPLELSDRSAVQGSLVMVPTGREAKGESGQTSFRILTEDDPSWDESTIFGIVLDGWDVLNRRAKGPDRESMGRRVMIASSYVVSGGGTDPNPKHDDCTQDNVDFYLSDSWTRAVIPLSEECLQQYQRNKLRIPGNTAVLLKGLPKMGTTWTEVLTEKMIEYVCSSGLYDCEFVKIGRGAVAAFAADRSDEAHVLRFSAESKHIFPAGKACGPGCWEPPLGEEIGYFGAHSADEEPPAWERCVLERKFWEIHECVPSWAGPPVEQWSDEWMDAAAKSLAEGGRRMHHDSGDPDSPPAGLIKKYLLVMRDPRDAAVSLVHYNTKFNPSDPAALQAAVRDQFPHFVAWQSFWYYYQIWRVGRHWPTMLLSYRDMLNNPGRQYARMLDYLGLKASVDTLDAVIAETSFASMKNMEANKELPGRNHANSDRAKVRSGKAGEFMEELDAETVEYCKSVMLDLLPPELNAMFGVQ